MTVQPLIALVTGANRGIGFEVCRQLGRLGYAVMLGARDGDRAKAAANTLAKEGLDVRPIRLDVTDDISVMAAVAESNRQFETLHVLVNNAGIGFDPADRPTSFSAGALSQVLDVNLFGPWRVTSAFLPSLIASRQGRIVNVSSEAGSFDGGAFSLAIGDGANASYGVSKAALNALTVKLAAALRHSGVLVNAVCPGWTATYPGGLEQGARPVAEGASSVVWAATLSEGGPTGGFFRDGIRLQW